MVAKYGTLRKRFLVRVPVDLWEKLDRLRERHCRVHGQVSMNAWVESILMDRVREDRELLG